jgi:alpha-beta hydrolase superfamily lysophospholipase
MILDHPLVSRRVFFPRSTDVEPSHYVDVGGANVTCYLRQPFPDAGLVLHFHGNGELASEYATHRTGMFVGQGVNVCFAEYRGYGLSSGVPAPVTMLGDGEKLVEALGVPPEKLVVFGRSLGSVYAIELVARIPRIAGLVLESAIANVLEDWPIKAEIEQLGQTMAEVVTEVETHFNLQQKLQAYPGHVLILHTQDDECVDRTHADRLYSWVGSNNKRLTMFPNGGHNTIFSANAPRYLIELKEFFQRAGIASKGEGGA